MGLSTALTAGLLLAVRTVMAQTDVYNSSERLLPQWLSGIIAVSCFLILIFIGFLVKKIWFEKSNGRKGNVDSARDDVDMNLGELRRKRSTKAQENDYVSPPSGDAYETKLEVVRNSNNMELGREHPYEMPDDNHYDTNLSIIRRGRSVEAKEEEESSYATSLEVFNSKGDESTYYNVAMDKFEDKATVM